MSTDRHDDSLRAAAPLTRLVEEPGAHASLAEHVAAAESTQKRARLQPGAVDRIEARLEQLEVSGPSAWRSLRAPAFVGAALVIALFAWSRSRPEPTVAVAPSAPAEPRPLHLDDGTLAVATDDSMLLVETPVARVEVAPRSQVRITVVSRGVRIAASSGSARILYYDGRVELVVPQVASAVEAPRSPKPTAHAAPSARSHPRTLAPALVPEHGMVAAPLVVDAEHQSFAAALARVRPAPSEALAMLDAHLQRWPNGALSEDAQRVRVAVLMKLDRKSDALATLDRMSSPVPELRIVRAELRSDVGRTDEAVADFGAVLVSDDERFAQRALFGRAMARQRAGQRARMTEDLERFLLLFPQGELSDRARLELRHATSASAR
jgi:hypothetical protein